MEELNFTQDGQRRFGGKMICEQRHEGSSHVDIGQKNFLGRGMSKYKASEGSMCLVNEEKQRGQHDWSGVSKEVIDSYQVRGY